MEGQVVKTTSNIYTVSTSDGKIFQCKVKGNFRLKGIRTTNPVAVGDRVHFLADSGMSWITHIEERKNYIVRRASNLSFHSQILAANIDQVALILTVNYPKTYPEFIDRFLATAEAYNIPAVLVINKMDCYSQEEMEYAESLKTLYEYVGYKVYLVSALSEETIASLVDCFEGKLTLFSGNSGVGKSTLLNLLVPRANAKTASISTYHNTGMHTTTFSEMFRLENGGKLIDTPGIKGFGTVDFKAEEVGHYFKDIFSVSHKCRFQNCTHTHEPHCAVKEAVENYEISESRYNSYLSVMSDAEEGKYR